MCRRDWIPSFWDPLNVKLTLGLSCIFRGWNYFFVLNSESILCQVNSGFVVYLSFFIVSMFGQSRFSNYNRVIIIIKGFWSRPSKFLDNIFICYNTIGAYWLIGWMNLKINYVLINNLKTSIIWIYNLVKSASKDFW